MLAILTTHPIQYQVPLWKALAEDGTIPFEVWYLSDHGTKATYDRQFGQTFAWDIDTLSGYPHRFLKVNRNADVSRFCGLQIEESLNNLFREKNVQALWIQGWQVFAYWQAVWAAYQLGIPVWLRAETNDLHKSHWFKRLPRNFALSQLFKRISSFLYIGSANRRFYQQFGVPDSKLIAAPYFVDNARFAQSAQELMPQRPLLRQHWSIAQDATCFLFCGKFIAKKHPLDLLEAARVLLERDFILKDHPKFHLLMVGDGELRPILEEKAHELESIAGRPVVSFTGFLNQSTIPAAYVAADWLILPSDAGETWGLVVNEALACGRPAIASHLCGCAEDLVHPLGDELIYECGNMTKLSETLQHLLNGFPPPNSAYCQKLVEQYSLSQTLYSVRQIYSGRS